MIKNVILSTLAIAVLAGCSGKKDSDKDTSVVEAIPVKIQNIGVILCLVDGMRL